MYIKINSEYCSKRKRRKGRSVERFRVKSNIKVNKNLRVQRLKSSDANWVTHSTSFSRCDVIASLRLNNVSRRDAFKDYEAHSHTCVSGPRAFLRSSKLVLAQRPRSVVYHNLRDFANVLLLPQRKNFKTTSFRSMRDRFTTSAVIWIFEP